MIKYDYNKFIKLCEEKSIKPVFFRSLGIEPSSLSRWKAGINCPNKRNITIISKYFNVDESYFYTEKQNRFPLYNTWKKLEALVDLFKLDISSLSKYTDVSRQTYYIWKNDGKMPTNDIMKKICNTFEIVPDYFNCDYSYEYSHLLFMLDKVKALDTNKQKEICDFVENILK